MSRLPHALLALALALGGCSTTPIWSEYHISDPLLVPAALDTARADLAAGRSRDAYERVVAARAVSGLSVEVRDEVEREFERCAARRIEELAQPGADPDDFDDLELKDLPRQLAVELALARARLFIADDAPLKAKKELEELETAFPRHHGRSEASALLVDAGIQLVRSDSGWWLWRDSDDGIALLEFVVLNYPSERRCDEAFYELARAYEAEEEYGLAIQRHEELVVSHVDSPLAVLSQARIPHLRLDWIESPEYDRKDLLRARRELELWLEQHAGHELETDVRLDLADCLARLVESDFGIARFYQKIDQPYGARVHALRARDVARESGSAALFDEAEILLASIPDVQALPGDRRPSDKAFSQDEEELSEALERARASESRSEAEAAENKP
jgi:hypothetical protein